MLLFFWKSVPREILTFKNSRLRSCYVPVLFRLQIVLSDQSVVFFKCAAIFSDVIIPFYLDSWTDHLGGELNGITSNGAGQGCGNNCGLRKVNGIPPFVSIRRNMSDSKFM